MKKILILLLAMLLAPCFVFGGDFQLLGNDIVIPGVNFEGSNIWVTTPNHWNNGNHQLDFGCGPASNIIRFYGIVDVTMAVVLFQSDLNTPVTMYGLEINLGEIPAVENILLWGNLIDTRIGIVEAPNFTDLSLSRIGFQADIVQLKFTTATTTTK